MYGGAQHANVHGGGVKRAGDGGSSGGGMRSSYGHKEVQFVTQMSPGRSTLMDYGPSYSPSRENVAGVKGSGASGSAATVATRVAKACVPCSTKKRRCDGGKPQCKVCMVLGSDCSYESRGLKRGPPKGFRSGPKESAKAKLLRSLETTIRDLALHMGREDAEREIVRISSERGINVTTAPRRIESGNVGGSSIKREHSAPAAPPTLVEERVSTSPNDREDVEDVLGISEQGTVRYIGSSSGIQLLHSTSAHPTATTYGNRPQHSPVRSSSYPVHPSPIHLPSVVSSARLHGSPSTASGPSATSAGQPGDTQKSISKSMNRRLFKHYWSGFHNFWPILYKPALDHIDVDRLPDALDVALVYAIYAIAACVAHPALDNELDAELGDGPAGEVFAQRAEQHLFQTRSTPLPSFASIQCCFLLACYHQGVGQLSKAYLFSCLANGMAIDLGLHRHLHQYEHDRIERESRSRLIHCIHILSTLLSAEMGRPPMLRSKDIDVPPMNEQENDEFESDSLGRPLHTLSLLNYSRRLFAIVETVLSQVHSFRRKAALRRMGSEGIRRVVDEIDESLESWRKSLPDWLRLDDDDGNVSASTLSGSPVPSFAAVQVWYYTAKILLHRPFIPQDEGLALSDLLNDKYHRKCTQAAQSSFNLLQRLAKASSVDRLSTDLAYIIFTTAVMFVFNARLAQTDDQGERSASRRRIGNGGGRTEELHSVVRAISTDAKRNFLMCKEWLRKLSDRWPSASAHKQLLDGFSVVGEGVLDGETHQYVGRRPSLLGGGGGDAPAQSFEGRPTSAGGYLTSRDMSSYESSGIVPYSMATPADAAYTTHSLPAGTFVSAGATAMSGGGGGLTVDALDANNVEGVVSQQSLNAYFEFAPNIFDMENVYWNETATRMTPFIGARDGGANAIIEGTANVDDGLQHQHHPGHAHAQSHGSGYDTFTSPRTFHHFSASPNFVALSATPPVQVSPHVSKSMAPPSMMASAPPSSKTISSSRKRSQVSERKSGSTTSGETNESPGLQMLAQQAVQTTRTYGEPDLGGGGGGGGGSSATMNAPVHAQHFVATPSSTTASTANSSGTLNPPPLPLPMTSFGSSFSPFSFHQEPSAPEWGDVISMLQLPPAFIQ